MRRHENFILISHNAAIAIIATIDPHPLPPLERLAEKAGTRRFSVVDGKDEADGWQRLLDFSP
jgi:hypothetical protein